MIGENRYSIKLPLKQGLRSIYILSFIIAVLMAAASLVGLLFPSTVYPADDLVVYFLPNDLITIIIGLPMLIVSIFLAKRGTLAGLLLWPGALFFILYNYCIYIFAIPLNIGFVLHLSLVTLSLYTLIALLAAIDAPAVKRQAGNGMPCRFSGGVLSAVGLFFLIRVLVAIVGAISGGASISETELALHVTDFIVAPAWIAGGILLWRKTSFGCLVAAGLLYQASMLFVGLIIVMLLQPVMTDAQLSVFDIVIVFLMGCITFVPFGLVLRGVAAASSKRD